MLTGGRCSSGYAREQKLTWLANRDKGRRMEYRTYIGVPEFHTVMQDVKYALTFDLYNPLDLRRPVSI